MSVCEVPVVSSVCESASEAVSSVVSAPFEWLAQGVGAAAEWMFKGVWQLFEATTFVNLSEPGYLRVYDVLFGVAVFLMLLFFCLQLLTGLVHREPDALRRAGWGLAKAVLGSFVVVTLVALALQITDELSIGIIQATGNNLEAMGGKIAALAAGLAAINIAEPGAGEVIATFLGGLAIVGAVIVWFSLLAREALLRVTVVMAPIALSGQSWDAARGWVSKWAQVVVALVVSKLVMVVIFLVAISQMSAPISLELSSITNPIAGVVLMLIAAFAPFMAYKFISFMGFDAGHLMSIESEARQVVTERLPVDAASARLRSMRKIFGGEGGQDDAASQPSEVPGGASVAPPGGGSPSGGPAGGGTPASGGSGGAAAGGGAAGQAPGAAGASAGAGAAAAGAGAAAAGVVVAQAVGRAVERHADAASATDGPAGRQAASEPAAPPTVSPAAPRVLPAGESSGEGS